MDKKGYNETVNKQSFGANGFNEITSAGAVVAVASSDRFAVIVASLDSVFSFNNEVSEGIKVSAGYSLSGGSSLYGYFKDIVVTTGKVVVYYAS